MRLSWTALGLSLSLGLAAGPARAEPPPAGASAAQLSAQRLAEVGLQLYQAEQYEGALGSFQEARRLYASPDLLVYIAAAHAGLGHRAEALVALLDFFPDAARATAALRTRALDLWRAIPQRVHDETLGADGARLPQALRVRLERLSLAERQYLPAELQIIRRAPPAVQPAAPQQLVRAAPPPRRWTRPGVLVPTLVLGGLGLGAIGAGAGLLAIHGSCATPGGPDTCARVYSTSTGGAVALGVGITALLGGAAWLIYDLAHRRPR